jgi:hypothetical protein
MIVVSSIELCPVSLSNQASMGNDTLIVEGREKELTRCFLQLFRHSTSFYSKLLRGSQRPISAALTRDVAYFLRR